MTILSMNQAIYGGDSPFVITQDEAKKLIGEAGGDIDMPHVRSRLAESLAEETISQEDAGIIAQQILDIAAASSDKEVLLVTFPAERPGVSAKPGIKADVGSSLSGTAEAKIKTAIANRDISVARGVYEKAPPADRAAIAEKLIADPDTRQEGLRLLAADPELGEVLAASETPAQFRYLVMAAVEATESASPLSMGERKVAERELARHFTHDPAELDRLWGCGTTGAMPSADRQKVAEIVMPTYIQEATPNFKNYTRLVSMAEDLSPGATRKDVTRALRRAYYPDYVLQFAGMSCGDYTPKHCEKLENFALKARWQEIPGPDGEQMDIAHALVAMDAYSCSYVGRLSAWVFTDFGDWVSGVMSKVGETGKGDNGDVDIRGNDFGEKMYEAVGRGTAAALPLSGLLRYAAAH